MRNILIVIIFSVFFLQCSRTEEKWEGRAEYHDSNSPRPLWILTFTDKNEIISIYDIGEREIQGEIKENHLEGIDWNRLALITLNNESLNNKGVDGGIEAVGPGTGDHYLVISKRNSPQKNVINLRYLRPTETELVERIESFSRDVRLR